MWITPVLVWVCPEGESEDKSDQFRSCGQIADHNLVQAKIPTVQKSFQHPVRNLTGQFFEFMANPEMIFICLYLLRFIY